MGNKSSITLDTNIILDIALRREHYISSSTIFQRIIDGEYIGYVAAHSLPTVFYYLSRAADETTAKNFLVDLLKYLEVMDLDHGNTCIALESDMGDFEDALIDVCCLAQGIDAIISHNVRDFVLAKTPTYTAGQFLEK